VLDSWYEHFGFNSLACYLGQVTFTLIDLLFRGQSCRGQNLNVFYKGTTFCHRWGFWAETW
jgi:hypothetical protein